MSRLRIRTVKPEFFQDEKVGHLSVHARLLFLGLITMADDEGRLRDHINAIHGHVFPYDELSTTRVKKAIAEVATADLILRYKAGVGEYIVIRHWGRHQRINRPMDSELPPPPDPVIVEENSFADSGDPRVPRGSIPEAVRRAVARREGATPGTTTDVACHYCNRPGTIVWPTISSGRASSWVTVSGLEFDHVVPVAAGGEHTLDNLVLACARCNRSKGARDLGTESRTEDVRNPVLTPSQAGVRSVPIPTPLVVGQPEAGVAAERDRLIDAALASLGDGSGADRLRETVAILRRAPRLTFDVELMAVANILALHPTEDHQAAATRAVADALSPEWKTTEASRALDYAFQRGRPRSPSAPTSSDNDRRLAAAQRIFGTEAA